MQQSRSVLMANFVLLFVLACLIVQAVGCREGTKLTATPEQPGLESYLDIVLIRVEEAEITLEDLLLMPQVHMMMKDTLITQEIVRQEAARRGVSVSQEEVKDAVDEFVEMQGGLELFLDTVPESIPPSLVMPDVTRSWTAQLLHNKVLEDEFEKTGGATEEKLREEWERDTLHYQRAAANDLEDVEEEDVTFETAREKVLMQLRSNFWSEHGQETMENMMNTYEVQNYVAELYAEPEEIEVPVKEEEVEAEEREEAEEEAAAEDGEQSE